MAASVALVLGLDPVPAAAAADLLWELSPYRVQVFVAQSSDPELAPQLAGELAASLAARAECVVGGVWELASAPAPPQLREAMLARFDHLPADDVLAALVKSDTDKVFLVRVAYAGGAYNVSVREFDVRTRLLGSPVGAIALRREQLADATFQAMLAAFAPLARIEGLADDEVTLRLRAASIPPRDASLRLLRDGEIFRPVIRVNDGTGAARRIQAVDWTYLVADRVDGPRVVARMHTGLRSPIGGRQRGRTEQLALAVRPPQADTKLRLVSRGESERPLAGYHVYQRPADATTTAFVGTTDRDGALTIPPGKPGVHFLLLKSGKDIVARLPILSGMSETVMAAIADDDRRLQAEGFIAGFQERFVDLVARREALMTRIRTRMQAGRVAEAKALLDQLKNMETQQQFSQMLTVARQKLVADDPRVQRKIDKLFDDTQQVVNRFLDPRAIAELERELREDAKEPPPATPAVQASTAAAPAAGSADAADQPAAPVGAIPAGGAPPGIPQPSAAIRQ